MTKLHRQKLHYAASRICGHGICTASFVCNHVNHTESSSQKLGIAQSCPLECYHIEPGDYEAPTLDDIHALCLACPHTSIVIRKKKRVFIRTGYVDVCVDCPVKMAEDRIYEEMSRKYRLEKNNMKMRIPTNYEWDKFMDVIQEDDDKAHWKKMFSWVHDPNFEETYPSHRVNRGYDAARNVSWSSSGLRDAHLGFRPAFDILETDALVSGLRDGDTVTIGTLYMGGKPVKVPQNLTYDGDIADYILGAKLEMQEALADPAYQVTAIRVGNVLIADRCLVRNISYDDTQTACTND